MADIGFPRSLLESDELVTDLVDIDFVRARFSPDRRADTHKGQAGHLLLVGGFDCMEGAIMLSANAAFETGVGLATLLTTETARTVVAGRIPELMTRPVPLSGGITGVENGIGEFFAGGRRYDALVMGPGMGRGEISRVVFETVLKALPGCGIRHAVIDGDGCIISPVISNARRCRGTCRSC